MYAVWWYQQHSMYTNDINLSFNNIISIHRQMNKRKIIREKENSCSKKIT